MLSCGVSTMPAVKIRTLTLYEIAIQPTGPIHIAPSVSVVSFTGPGFNLGLRVHLVVMPFLSPSIFNSPSDFPCLSFP